MVKIRVLKNFYDKRHELWLRQKGETYTEDEKRAEELANMGLIEIIDEPEPLKSPGKTKE